MHWLAFASIAFAPAAGAHSGHAESALAAFAHPFSGWDHLIVALLVGALAARSARVVALPALFVVTAAAGASAGLHGIVQPLEPALVGAAGVLLALLVAPQSFAIAAKVACAVAGFAHGVAHGAELPGAAASVLAGMLSATALLHAVGYALARALRREARHASR